jgi:hypothetical protein
MKKVLTMVLVAVFSLGLASAAFAGDGKRFDPSRKAVEAAGIKVAKATTGKDARGKEALVLSSSTRAEDAVAAFKTAFRAEKPIAGLKVVGLSHMVRTDTWNVTLRDGDMVRLVKISRTKNGCNLLLRQPFSAPAGK